MDELNLNVSGCLKSATGVFETVVTNICTGAVSTVPHGTVDILGGVFIGASCILMVAAIAAFIRALWIT